jgi:CheY-like chemotaxis protein
MSRTPATIVVLEENAAAQELIDQALRQMGDRVLVTNNPMEVFALAKRLRIDLLVGDIDEVERTEPKLARNLRSITRVLQVSQRSTAVGGDGDALRVEAPFSLDVLLKAVSAALSSQEVGR